MNKVEVSAAGQEPPPWAARCAKFAGKVLRVRRIRNWDLSILLCDDPTIRGLNSKYRGVVTPTDVLSFPQRDPGGAEEASPGRPPAARRAAGDIVISLETLRRNAEAGSRAEEEELKRLLIHGILHLEGMDHSDEDVAMLGIQERILAMLHKERVY